MGQYWLKRDANAHTEGPYSAPQLKQLVGMGIITPASFISNNQNEWHPAMSVRGLFPPPAAPTPQPPSPPLSPSADIGAGAGTGGPSHLNPSGFDPYALADDTPDPHAQSRYAHSHAPSGELASGHFHSTWPPSGAHGSASTYHTAMTGYPPGYGYAAPTARRPGRVRNVTWFLVLAIIHVVYGLITMGVVLAENLQDGTPQTFEEMMNDPLTASGGLICFGLVMLLGLWVCWLVWVYTVHDELARFIGDQPSISASMALGLSFVPLFNLFWHAYMPYRLAQRIHGQTSGWSAVSVAPPLVLTFQILAVIPGCCCTDMCGALTSLFTALSMLQMQKALNALWQAAAPAVSDGSAPWSHSTAG